MLKRCFINNIQRIIDKRNKKIDKRKWALNNLSFIIIKKAILLSY
jgi:hypothetical protein